MSLDMIIYNMDLKLVFNNMQFTPKYITSKLITLFVYFTYAVLMMFVFFISTINITKRYVYISITYYINIEH